MSLATQMDLEEGAVDGLRLSFDAPVAVESLNATTVRLIGPLGEVPGTFEMSGDGRSVRLRASHPMYANEVYRGAVSGVRGSHGEQMIGPAEFDARVPVRPMTTAGFFHSCTLQKDGRVLCWGRGDFGALGNGSPADHGHAPGSMGGTLRPVLLGPTSVGAPARALEIATSDTTSCARLDDGRVKCWGANDAGALGIGLPVIATRGTNTQSMGDALPAVALGTGRRVLQLAGGGEAHFCALLDDATIKCWGKNSEGQLGTGDLQSRGTNSLDMGDNLLAIDLGPGRRAVQAAVGAAHSCALLDDGAMKCWGSNSRGQLGFPSLLQPDASLPMGDALPVVGLGLPATFVSAGDEHTCALLTGGTLKCWGCGTEGQLGLGNAFDSTAVSGLPNVDLGAARYALAVRAGASITCVLLSTGAPACWGTGQYGALGLDSQLPRGVEPGQMGDNVALALLAPGEPFVSVDTSYAAFNHVCARRADGQLWCWGKNLGGRLGQGYVDPGHRGDTPGDMATLKPIDLGL